MPKNTFSFSEHSSSILDLENYYFTIAKLIERKHQKETNPNFDEDFKFMRLDEVSQQAEILMKELTFEGNLALLSYIESLFRIDAVLRCQSKKKKDPMVKAFLKEVKSLNGRRHYHHIRIKETILSQWEKTNPHLSNLINELNQAFDYRNWLAHGHYWAFKEPINKYSFEYVLKLAKQTEINIKPLLYQRLNIGEKIT